MRMFLLMVCLFALQACCPFGKAQEAEVAFDPTPVVLPTSIVGTPRAITSSDLLEMRQVHGLSLSPDGTQIAVVVGQANVANNNYRTGAFLVSTAGTNPPISLGSAGMPNWDQINQWTSEAPQWSKDGQLLTYRMKMRADASWQVWAGGRSDRVLRQLTRVSGDVLAYKWDLRENKFLLEVRPPATAESEKLTRAQGILYDDQILPWEGMGAILKSVDLRQRKTQSWVHELETGIEREASDSERKLLNVDLEGVEREFGSRAGASIEACKILSVKPSSDNGAVALLCSPEVNHSSPKITRVRLYVMAGKGGPPALVSESYWVTDYWWDGRGELLYYVSIQGDGRAGKMNVFDLHSGETHEFFRTSEILREFSMDPAGRFVACTRETSTSPAQIGVIDLENGTLRTAVDLNPQFKYFRISVPERVAGTNHFREEWFGQLVKPSGYEPGKRYPLIVTLYRSGDYFLLGASGNENPIQVYAAHGFAVLSLDIGRFRNRNKGDFEDALLDWASPTASLEMAVQTLVDSGIVDGARVGITGFSRGAEILEYAISHTKIFHAAVESSPGARDPYFYYMAGRHWHDFFANWGLGGWPEAESKENWKKVAAPLNANRIETPLLMNVPDSEFIANLALFTSLEELRKPVELFIYADELHMKNQPKHLHEIHQRNLDWFSFWLQDHEDPTSAKEVEYLRWRKLRETAEGHPGTEN
jgi:dipeptidyl aminopeptidase/acylaminoacyl peptidase